MTKVRMTMADSYSDARKKILFLDTRTYANNYHNRGSRFYWLKLFE